MGPPMSDQPSYEREQRWIKRTFFTSLLVMLLSLVTVLSVWIGRTELAFELERQRVAIAALATRVAALEAAQAPTQPQQLPQGPRP